MTLRILERLAEARQRRKTRCIIASLPRHVQRDIGIIDGRTDGALHRSR
ncbi:MAG: hypothetical protein AAGI50_09740 [Pseudomonadota bacterium]